jgi:hypothetical protein
MRLWSLHPSYLDRIGLVALWREGLLARKVLQGKTYGYRHHPQLYRFQAHQHPDIAIETYLWSIYEESVVRGYHFDPAKLQPKPQPTEMQVTEGQLKYELNHLLRKLRTRDRDQYRKLSSVNVPQAHPLFRVVPGPIEAWERTEHSKTRPTQRAADP